MFTIMIHMSIYKSQILKILMNFIFYIDSGKFEEPVY